MARKKTETAEAVGEIPETVIENPETVTEAGADQIIPAATGDTEKELQSTATEEPEQTDLEKSPDESEATLPSPADVVVEDCGAYAYIGPSIPKSKLSYGKVFQGTRSQVVYYLAEEITLYPGVRGLLTPVTELMSAKVQVGKKGTPLQRKFAALETEIKARKAGKKE